MQVRRPLLAMSRQPSILKVKLSSQTPVSARRIGLPQDMRMLKRTTDYMLSLIDKVAPWGMLIYMSAHANMDKHNGHHRKIGTCHYARQSRHGPMSELYVNIAHSSEL